MVEVFERVEHMPGPVLVDHRVIDHRVGRQARQPRVELGGHQPVQILDPESRLCERNSSEMSLIAMTASNVTSLYLRYRKSRNAARYSGSGNRARSMYSV